MQRRKNKTSQHQKQQRVSWLSPDSRMSYMDMVVFSKSLSKQYAWFLSKCWYGLRGSSHENNVVTNISFRFMVQVYTQHCFPKVKMLLNHVAGNMLRETTFSTEEQADKTNVPFDQSIDGIIPSIWADGGGDPRRRKKNSFAGKNRTYNLNSYPVSN